MGLTYLFISHDISVIGYLSDRVAVMYLGEIVEMGPVESVLSRPRHPYTQSLMSAVPEVDSARQAPARAADRRPALAAQSAAGLQVPHPLPLRHRHLQARGPGDRDARARPSGRLPPGCMRASASWSAPT